MAAETQYFFSTGRLYYMATPTSVEDLFNNELGFTLATLQDIDVVLTSQKVELFAPPQESMYPVATGHVNGSAEFNIRIASINADALVELVGMSQTGQFTNTVPKVMRIPELATLFEGFDDQDRRIAFAMPRVRFPGTTFQMQRNNFAMQNLRGEGYPVKDGPLADAVCYIRFYDE